MKHNMKKILQNATALLALAVLATGCQKMDRPAMSDYPVDANPPGGPLNFYVAFDGTSSDPLMNAVDSIRANFAAQNPFTTIDGISGKAVQGVNKKTIKYSKPNDWASQAKSFTIGFWYKRDGQTKNNAGTNGPEYIASFKSNNGHWSGSSMLLFLEGSNTACAVKVMMVDKNKADNWFTWEGGNTIPGLLDNKWHQISIVYDATASALTLYVDGVANPNKRNWGGHGNINMDNNAIVEMRVGAGPSDNIDSDDWLASSWKGGIDQFRMYSAALTATEIQGLVSGKK